MSQLGNSDYVRRTSLRRAAIFDPTLPGDFIDHIWHDPASLVGKGKMMRRTGQRRTVHLDWDGKHYVLKHYRPTWWHFVRQLTSSSRAASTFHSTLKLIDAGVRTPRPLACVENRWGSLRRDSFLMYEYVEGVTLQSYLTVKAKHPRPLTENLSRQLHELWQRLGDLRASLSDTHTGNFIVGAADRLWVIDLDRARFHRTMLMAARQQERGWAKFVRSAAKCGTTEVIQMRIKRRSIRPVASPVGK